jgi:hypothetical protein
VPTSNTSPTSTRRARAALNAQRALALRASGATLAAIGAELGISDVAAGKLIRRALDKAYTEAAHELRTIEGARLDALQHAHWDAALAGDVPATHVVVKVMERRARLFGLDAPVKVAVSDETSQAVRDLLDDLESRIVMDAGGSADGP